MATILAIDLGKYKSVACVYNTDADGTEPAFVMIATGPQSVHDLLVEVSPDRVVFEVGSSAGWVKDICETLEIEVQVANPNHEAWRWKNVKRKTDRDDALRLAKLSASGELPTVQLPSSQVRQWRSLIAYRSKLVGRRTTVKNSIRSILDRQGLHHASGKKGWTKQAVKTLEEMSRPLETCDATDLWRGQLAVELQALDQVEVLLETVEKKLEDMASADERVTRIRTIPGVGRCLAELVVAVIDDPKRFKNGKQVGSYVGLAPKQYESGTMSRTGRITGQGHILLRALLVEVGWLMRRYNAQLTEIFEKVCRGSQTRRKVACIAVARRLMVTCWAMLRDGTCWREPAVG